MKISSRPTPNRNCNESTEVKKRSPENDAGKQSSPEKRYQPKTQQTHPSSPPTQDGEANNVSAGTSQQQAAPQPTSPSSPKRKRGHPTVDASDPTPVTKEHLSVREGGDIDLGMLDQEAFARVLASGQQQNQPEPLDQDKDVDEDEEEDEPDIVDDVTYRPSGVGLGEDADPIWSLRMSCLPVLDIFSTELLKILSSHPHSTILQIVTGTPASPLSHNYNVLLKLFDATKKQLYSEDQVFLDPDVLGFKEIQERKVIRKANLATFISSVFGSVDVGFFHLNEGFLTTMAPDGGRLLKDMARLFLDLKTQAYISAMGQPSRDQSSILNDLFLSTPQLTHLFVARRTIPNTLQSAPTQEDLTPAEAEFISKCERRRELLRSLGDGEKQVQELKDSYSWESFLRELRSYVAKNWEIVVGSRGGKPRRAVKKRTSAPTAGYIDDVTGAQAFIAPIQQTTPQPTQPSTSQPQGIPTALPTNQPIWEAYEKARMTTLPATPVGPAGANMGSSSTGIPPPQTPVNKATTQGTPRSTGDRNQIRRPWTKEEEIALFAGLEAVQGPNWAAILQLYGPGGSISEALKDRSQVQLKDKARNLKLFFLKGGHEVPPILNLVTGRLKTEGAPADETPTRRGKRRRMDTAAAAAESFDAESQPTQQAFADGTWSQTAQTQGQGQDYEMGQNVDPGLQMPQGS